MTTTSIPLVENGETNSYDIIRFILYIVFGLNFYTPIIIILYWKNRHKRSIRYRHPLLMTITSTFVFLFCFGRCINTLFLSSIPCLFQLLITGIPIQFVLLGYILTKLHVVLTFYSTKLMAAHTENKSFNRIYLNRLQFYFRHLLFIWCISQFIWNIPFLILVFTTSDSFEFLCSSSLTQNISILYGIETFIAMFFSMLLSRYMSKTMDNFGLRHSFLRSTRLMFILFCIALPATFFHTNKIILTYKLDFFSQLTAAHTFLYIHIMQPVFQSFSDREINDIAFFRGTVPILDAYLNTTEGYEAFSKFSKLEFTFECVIAWKTIVDYRLGLGLNSQQIYNQHLAPDAPLPLSNTIPKTIIRRYQMAYSKSLNNPNEKDYSTYYDVLFEAISTKLIHETLIHFQKHPLGIKWSEFVQMYQMKTNMDKILDPKSAHDILTSLEDIPKRGHLLTIQSCNESFRMTTTNE